MGFMKYSPEPLGLVVAPRAADDAQLREPAYDYYLSYY